MSHSSISEAQLREANERLVLATVHAQTMAAAAEEAAAQLQEANEHLVVATVVAQRMKRAAEQATAQISEMAKLEARLQEAQKLETLGVLAGGVAHDFNNILAAIVGHANLGSISVDPESKVAHHFEVIEQASMKAADLTRQLLAYAGEGKVMAAEVDLNIVVKEITQILSLSIPRHVALRFDLAERLPFLLGDSTQIFQVLMNLITNAFEAFAEGENGLISIKTGAEGVHEADLESGGWTLPVIPGRYATVEVSDTGAGMAPEVVARVFDPFFSTKFTGRGLGLAAVMGIVRSHGGGLRVRSEPGAGTSFKIYLPAMQEARSIATLETLPEWHGEGRILVVDPEDALRTMAQHMAEQLGFSIIEAEDGREAVDIFRIHHGELALVLMDLSMPRMGGQEAFREMQTINRSVPVVLSGGYTVPDSDMFVEGVAGFLKKPYRVSEFQSLLQRVLSLPPNAPA